jgi:hypothetical protein
MGWQWLCGCGYISVMGDRVAVARWQWVIRHSWVIASILIGDKSGFGLAVAGLHWQCDWVALLIIHAR